MRSFFIGSNWCAILVAVCMESRRKLICIIDESNSENPAHNALTASRRVLSAFYYPSSTRPVVPKLWIRIMLACRTRYATHLGLLSSSSSSVHRVHQRAYNTAPKSTFRSATRPCAKPRATPRSSHFQYRGTKRKTTLEIDGLPQGAIISDPLPPQDDSEPQYPPLLQQVRNQMLKFSNCVLVTRVGGFYEVYHTPRNQGLVANVGSCISRTLTSMLRF
jgi:hypothetical protein